MEQDNTEEVQAAFERGKNHYMNADYDQSITEFTEMIRLDPNNAYAYACRGDSYRMKNQFDQAISDCIMAISLNPNDVWAYAACGDACRMNGQYDEAIKAFNEAIKLDPDHAWVYVRRGESYRMKGQYDQAVADAEKTLELNPNSDFAKAVLRRIPEMDTTETDIQDIYAEKGTIEGVKILDVKLNGILDVHYGLEVNRDKNGNENGILIVPYVKWLSPDEIDIRERVYEVSGAVLECIEKQYFDNNVIAIPVKGYSEPVKMEDFLYHSIPDEIYHQMLTGTFEIADDADKSIYGNMPSKVSEKAQSVKADEQPRAKVLKDPSLAESIASMKKIIPEFDQIMNGTFDFEAYAEQIKHDDESGEAGE